jgi:hypothetical protein
MILQAPGTVWPRLSSLDTVSVLKWDYLLMFRVPKIYI